MSESVIAPVQIPLLKGLFQICYVTVDLDAGMRTLTEKHGISRFRVKRGVPSGPGMPKMRIDQAHVFIGPMQIELIQPAGGDDGLYRDFCPADGAAIRFHHFGMWMDDAIEYSSTRACLSERNIPMVFEMSMPNVGRVIYADARSTLGHYLEYVHLVPEVKRVYYADVPQY